MDLHTRINRHQCCEEFPPQARQGRGEDALCAVAARRGHGVLRFAQGDSWMEVEDNKVTASQDDSIRHWRQMSFPRGWHPRKQNMLSIRQADASDVTLLATLIHEFAEFERLPVRVTEQDLFRDGFGPQPRFHMLITEWNGAPAGYAMFFHCYSSFEGRAAIYLEDVYVRTQYRGKGIGKAVIGYLAEMAAKDSLCGVRWQVLDWNAPAIEFYRRLGAQLQEDRKVFSLEGQALLRLAERAA